MNDAMSDATRRGFLVIAGAGTAAVATAGAVVLTQNSHEQSSHEKGAVEGHDATGAMVAWIGDVTKSEITIMLGEREVVVQDAGLVAKLVAASGQV